MSEKFSLVDEVNKNIAFSAKIELSASSIFIYHPFFVNKVFCELELSKKLTDAFLLKSDYYDDKIKISINFLSGSKIDDSIIISLKKDDEPKVNVFVSKKGYDTLKEKILDLCPDGKVWSYQETLETF